ncbi:MAG: transglycosylase SLT domain-containing protein [Gemmatimonadaceae bacterium]|nr:transglycosylase SLT domain-containing protein [Gemmatimonadaceae bacterium]
MTDHGDDYAHRGDRDRRQVKVRRWIAASGTVVAGLLVVRAMSTTTAEAAAAPTVEVQGQPIWRPAGEVLTRRPQSAPPGLSAPATLRRRHQIFSYATRYRISNDLSAAIYDAAVAERIEPELAFRLVRVESQFKDRARSSAGAVGLTQLMVGTARYFQPGITREQLYDRNTNLRIGFRYLRSLVKEYKGNLRLALLAYNRGPVAVENELAMGLDPANGYEQLVMKGYRGSGVLK